MALLHDIIVFWIKLVELATAGRVGTDLIAGVGLCFLRAVWDVRKCLALCV